MELRLGTVTSVEDATNTGLIKVSFGTQEGGTVFSEWVHYVSPFGTPKSAFMGLPDTGSLALCAYAGADNDSLSIEKGYFYLGSVMGAVQGLTRLIPGGGEDPGDKTAETPPSKQYTPTDMPPGIYGPQLPPDQMPQLDRKDRSVLPEEFRNMYEGDGVTPEKKGMVNQAGGGIFLSSRSRPNSSLGPFQDFSSEIKGGSGKRVACVDSPMVDGVVITNEHKGKDYIILSTGKSQYSPFAEGELCIRTHGPINQYTLESGIHMWVEEGKNIHIENRATGLYSPLGDRTTTPPLSTATGSNLRSKQVGNEDYGCVNITSHHNNITLSALAEDSVITITSPGANSKIVVDSRGSVDIRAGQKLTLQSDTEVEINAPLVDINGGNNVYIDAPRIDLNGPNSNPPTL